MKTYLKDLSCEFNEMEDNQSVSGYFTTDMVDVDGHIVFKEDILAAMNDYLKWGNIRANHQQPVGVLIEYNPAQWNFFKTKIVDEDVWNKVKEGVYKGFSLGLKVAENGLKRIPLSQISPDKYMHLPKVVIDKLKSLGYVQRIQDFYIAEISITDRPRNLGSIVTHFKSEGGDETLPSIMEECMENENSISDNGGVVEENEPTITKDESNSVEETVVLETENVVEKSDGTESGVEVSNIVNVDKAVNAELAESEFAILSEKIETLSKAIGESFASIFAQLTIFAETITKSEVIDVSKSEALDTVTSADNFKTLKDEIVDELKSFVKSEFGDSSGERKGAINAGDTPEETKSLNVMEMSKSEGYQVLAGIIAKSIKR